MDAAFRKGYYKFKEAARFVIDSLKAKFGKDLTDQITLDHLQGAYIGMAGRYKDKGADRPSAVIAYEDRAALETENARDTNDGNKQDSGNGADEAQVDEAAIRDGRQGESSVPVGSSSEAGKEGDRPGSDTGVSDDVPPAGRESIDQPVRNEDGGFEPKIDDARSNVGTGSDPDSRSGLDTVTGAEQSTPQPADQLTFEEKLAAQKAAGTIPVTVADQANIDATLPFLHIGQREDVNFAETRWAKPNGYGVLFTNGTGTGKTYVGLGAIKRMVMQGKGNGIIVVPDDEVMKGWIRSAPNLGLTVTKLENEKDSGNGIAITTYANFGDNDSLAKRKFDFVVMDEVDKVMSKKTADDTRHGLTVVCSSTNGTLLSLSSKRSWMREIQASHTPVNPPGRRSPRCERYPMLSQRRSPASR
jgi:hypothetical protein